MNEPNLFSPLQLGDQHELVKKEEEDFIEFRIFCEGTVDCTEMHVSMG